MRYVKQPDRVSCGPIAVLNVLKWLGEPATIKSHLPFLQFGCHTIDLENPDDFDASGTTDWDFDRVLRYVTKGRIKVCRKKRPSISPIKQHLEAQGTVCLSYRWEERNQTGEHFVFIAGIENNSYVCVNDHNSETISYVPHETLKKWLKVYPATIPYAWFLTKLT